MGTPKVLSEPKNETISTRRPFSAILALALLCSWLPTEATQMTRRLTSAALTLLTAVAMLAPAPSAQAQCTGDEAFCASINVGVNAGVGVRIGRRRAPPPVAQPPVAQQVIVTPAPPPQARVVIVQTQPPPPPPRVVVVQRQPPPPRRTVVVVQQQPQQATVTTVLTPVTTDGRLALHGHIGGIFGQDVSMGGFTGALRIRPVEHFAIDLGIGAYGGTDYSGASRVEVPVTVDALFFVNPQHRLQLYFLAGIGGSWGHRDEFDFRTGTDESRDFAHIGAEAGIGLEWRLSQHFALNTDIRGFVRQRVDSDERPEFVNTSTGETTDTSAGALGTFGATFYW